MLVSFPIKLSVCESCLPAMGSMRASLDTVAWHVKVEAMSAARAIPNDRSTIRSDRKCYARLAFACRLQFDTRDSG